MKTKIETKEQKKSTWTFFMILFPSLILATLLMFQRTKEFIVIGILLFFYQGIILKKFTETYYGLGETKRDIQINKMRLKNN